MTLEKGLIINFAVLGLIFSFGCKGKNEYVAPPPPKVTVSKLHTQNVVPHMFTTGKTASSESIDLRARVEGYLQTVNFQAGSYVKAGDLLMTIDPAPFQAQLDSAKASLLSNQASLRLAQATLMRKEDAFKSRAVSEVEVIEARAQKDVAEAAIAAAQAAVDTAALNLGYTKIVTPISGRASRNLVDRGNLVGRGDSTLLTTVEKIQPIYTYFSIGERELIEMMRQKKTQERKDLRGWPVEIGYPDKEDFPCKGSLDFIDNKIDQTTGTLQLRATYPNDDNALVPGALVKVRIPLGEATDSLVIPERAVAGDLSGKYALVVGDNNIVEQRHIETGQKVNGNIVIISGLKAEDRIVVNGLQRARPGLPVTPVDANASSQTKESK